MMCHAMSIFCCQQVKFIQNWVFWKIRKRTMAGTVSTYPCLCNLKFSIRGKVGHSIIQINPININCCTHVVNLRKSKGSQEESLLKTLQPADESTGVANKILAKSIEFDFSINQTTKLSNYCLLHMVTHEKFHLKFTKIAKNKNARWARSQRIRTSASLVITLKLIDCAQSIKIFAAN